MLYVSSDIKGLSYYRFKKDFLAIMNLAFKKCNESNREISVTFVDEKKIKKINKEHREKNEVTDVISFAFDDTGFKSIALGDIIICHSRAVEQAKKYNHSLRREMAFLYCHGLLHLLGYDHEDEKKEKEMFDLQDVILSELNIRR